ncbi:hypothetical protein LOD99_7286 [Oopsacas minuta]|uniref:DUF4291 domain-containing protein n=1 Tax=Oopsacas minuta TaxID=111878 RepID=A0AAV7JUX4_9METZ|nr:hypothetical protein LOD99_7286 [Oopsacas minuta]
MASAYDDEEILDSATMLKIPPNIYHFMKYWSVAPYLEMKTSWPKEGKHILAQFDDENIFVYQAFNPQIAEFAVKNQKFGGPDYLFSRMSWIKTNFLWMMYRSNWASKKNQERILAIQITRASFETILSNALIPRKQKEQGLSKEDLKVRLQWDPDHAPSGGGVPRRAIQLGLKGKILEQFGTEWVTRIIDITPFVTEMHAYTKCHQQLFVAREEVYPLTDPVITELICLESDD